MDGSEDVAIRLDGVGKTFPDGTTAVSHLSLDVPRGQTVVLIGPSGCGKSTTLRMVNRLIEPSEGRVIVEGEDISTLDPVRLRRGIGYVIQHVGLFPHQTVRANVATVPRLLGWPRGQVSDRVDEMLELVGLDPGQHGARYPHQLSGGQQQRVGVARALAADPPVLLMDEPFGAVDPIVREHLQAEFRALQQRLHKTVLFVTHDVDEAVRLGDRIAVLAKGGELEQYDRPARVLADPATPFVADFVGADRSIKQLAVTPVSDAELLPALVLPPTEPHGSAAARLSNAGGQWALVGDENGVHGWVDRAWLTAGNGSREVGQLARSDVPTVPSTANLREALAVLLAHPAGWVLVVDDGHPSGLLTPEALHAALRAPAPR